MNKQDENMWRPRIKNDDVRLLVSLFGKLNVYVDRLASEEERLAFERHVNDFSKRKIVLENVAFVTQGRWAALMDGKDFAS